MGINTGTFPVLEYARRRLAIRLVALVSAGNLVLMAIAWIVGD